MTSQLSRMMNYQTLAFAAALAAWSLSTSVSLAQEDDCIVAYQNVTKDMENVCNIDGLTFDQLQTQECPTECQALYDAVLTNCEDGENYLAGFTSPYNEYSYTLFRNEGHKWAACDYGYAASECERAYLYMEKTLENTGSCLTFGLTVEELQTEECPSECQALYDIVMESCQPGVDIYEDYGNSDSEGLPYQEATIYHGQLHFKREQCNYFYEPTSCDIAYKNLQYNTDPDSSSLITPDAPAPVCMYEDNQDACSSECIAFIDNVLSSCTAAAEYAPNTGFLSTLSTRIAWEGSKSLGELGFNPTTTDLLGRSPLSEVCWDYYTAKAPAESSSASRGRRVKFMGTLFVILAAAFHVVAFS